MKIVLAFCFFGLAPGGLLAQVVDLSAIRREVDSLLDVANTFSENRKFDNALGAMLAAKTRALRYLGKESATYGQTVYVHGKILYQEGRYWDSEPLLLEALQIQGKTLGKEHSAFLLTQNRLATLYKKIDRFSESESLFLESISTYKKIGKINSHYLQCLKNLASVYSQTGEYEKAEPLLLLAKSIREKRYGKDNKNYAGDLHDLANFYKKIDQYEKSEKLYLESIAIQRTLAGSQNISSSILMSLANLYRNMDLYEKAEGLYLEALEIRKTEVSESHPEYGDLLLNMGNLYHDLGNYSKSEDLFLKTKTIWDNAFGQFHGDCALVRRNLGDLYMDMGRFNDAEFYFQEAKHIREKVFGNKNEVYAGSLVDLIDLYFNAGRIQECEFVSSEFFKIKRSLHYKFSIYFSEREIEDFCEKFSGRLNRHFSYTQIQSKIPLDLSGIGFDNALFYKGLTFSAARRLRALSYADTAVNNKVNRLLNCNRRLATEYSKPISEQKDIPGLEDQSNQMEKELTRAVADNADMFHEITWQQVQQKLKTGNVAIEFVHYRYYAPKRTDSTMYAALVLRPHDTAPHFIPLFEERQLARFLPKSNDQDRIDAFYAIAAGQAVYQLVWAPLDGLLQGVSTVYCSPSGLLHRINLGALPVSETQIFADRHQLVTLGSTRQLVIAGDNLGSGNTAILFGGIQYDYKPESATVDSMRGIALDSTDFSTVALTKRDLPFPYDTTLRGAPGTRAWTPLAATETEVRNISSLLQKGGFQTIIHSAAGATEEAFKQLGHEASGSPRILHLATHGYFFPDPKETPQAAFVGEDRLVFRASEHPMIRSGLILAGANKAWTSGQAPAGREDGILTAYEISQINLAATELVVLSACETGLGQIEGNEGVYGLQRAFKIAGVKYLIMSLWQVSDQATGELMTEFYRQYLEKKLPVPAAFRAAQARMRGKYPGSPWAWAGFVLVE